MRLALCVVLAVSSAGCASPRSATYSAAPQPTWNKPGATRQDFNVDSAGCRVQLSPTYQARRDRVQAQMNQPTQMAGNVAIRQSPTQGAAGMMQILNINAEEQAALSDCMTSKGWTLS